MKTFLIGFSVILFLVGILSLLNSERDGGKFGRQESYQSIPAGIMMIGLSALSLYAGDPRGTLKWPKTEKEKRERMKWVVSATYCFFFITIALCAIEPGWGVGPTFRSLEQMKESLPSTLALTTFLYVIAAPLAYFSTET